MSINIFKASAGSGKTFTLSATYIAHLITTAEDFPHKHQLAVTFTNKATAEMKERILQYLFQLSHDLPETDNFFQEIRRQVPDDITNTMIRRLAKKALHNIIHDYDHFHVTTIDSFFQSLLTNLAHEVGLSASFKVELTDTEVLSKAVDRILANLQDNSKELEWITEYIRKQMNDDKSWNIAHGLKKLAEQITKENYMVNSHLLQDTEETESKKSAKEGISNSILRNYQHLLRSLENDSKNALRKVAEETIKAIEEGLTFDAISHGNNIKNWLMTMTAANADISKAPGINFISYSTGTKSMLKSANIGKEPWESMASNVQRHLNTTLQQYYRSTFIINSCRLSLANLYPLRLLERINHEVQQLNKENDRMLLASTPLLFYNLSKENDTSFVFERAGTNYKHVMIDEFQDTSRLQWENMHNLLLENTSQGNTCMLVGDVKQGIYRFRGGDWNALASFKKGYNHELNTDISIQNLPTNFRSGKEIVEFNNRLFTTAPAVIDKLLSEDYTSDEFNSRPSARIMNHIYPTPDPANDAHDVTQIVSKEGGYVRVHFYDKKATDAKKSKGEKTDAKNNQGNTNIDFFVEESVAEQMLRLHAIGVPFNEMAILIRSKNDTAALMQHFNACYGPTSSTHIPLISEEAFLLDSSPAVLTIINALKYINNTTDGIALEFLRQHYIGNDFNDIIEQLTIWHGNHFDGLPFYEAVCRIIVMFSIETMAGQSPYTYYFLDALTTFIDENTATPQSFLQYWEDSLHSKAIPPTAIDGVRILTIHKSKGLAFHTVFVPWCDWKIEGHTELMWITPKYPPYNNIPLLPINISKTAANSIYREEYLQEKFNTYAENLNLMYVAFTRPKQNLLIWATENGIGKILHDTLDPCNSITECGTPSNLGLHSENRIETGKATTNPLDYKVEPINVNYTHHEPRLVFRQSNNAQMFLADTLNSNAEQDIPAHLQQKTYRETGIMLHLLMSSIESTDDIDQKISLFARAQMFPAGMTERSVRNLILKRIKSPIASEWFDGSWTLFRECGIICRKDGKPTIIRPDRVMTRTNPTTGTRETIVIDFKFGSPKNEYHEQVRNYMQRLKAQSDCQVKGFLWYLYTGNIEEVHENTN